MAYRLGLIGFIGMLAFASNSRLRATLNSGSAGAISSQSESDDLYTVSGTIFDSSGQPVPGALVRFKDSMDPWEKTLADENGRFEFGVDCKLHALVYFYSPENSEVTWMELLYENILEKSNTPQKIELTPATTFQVTVRQNGDLIEGASVVARTKEHGWNFAPESTDAKGVAELVIPTSHTLNQVWAAHSERGIGGGPAPTVAIEGDSQMTIELLPSRKRTVLVVDQEDQPVVGIRVRANLICSDRSRQTGQLPELDGYTNQVGKAEFGWVPTSNQYIPHFGIYGNQKYDWDQMRRLRNQRLIKSDDERDNEVVYVIAKPIKIPVSGLLEGTGKWKPGIRIAGTGQAASATRSDRFETTTDANGRFSAMLIPGLTYAMGVTDEHWASDPTVFTIKAGDPNPDLLKIPTYRAAKLQVSVTHGKNRLPVTGAKIRHITSKRVVLGPNHFGNPSVSQIKELDEHGRAEFGSAGGKIKLIVGKQNWQSIKEIDVTPGQTLTVEIHAAGIGARQVFGSILPPESEQLSTYKESLVAVNKELALSTRQYDPEHEIVVALRKKQTFLEKQIKEHVAGFVEDCDVKLFDRFYGTKIPPASSNGLGNWSTTLDTHMIAVRVISANGKYGGLIFDDEVGTEIKPVRIKPTVRVAGRLVDRVGGPLAGIELVQCHESRQFDTQRQVNYVSTKTDKDGRFTFDSVLIDIPQRMGVALPRGGTRFVGGNKTYRAGENVDDLEVVYVERQ